MVLVFIPLPKAHDNTSDDEHGIRLVLTVHGGLDNDTKHHDRGSRHDDFPSTELVTKHQREHSPSKTSDFVDGRHEALDRRVVVRLGNLVVELRGRDQAAHHTLIISEQQKATRADDRDE